MERPSLRGRSATCDLNEIAMQEMIFRLFAYIRNSNTNKLDYG